MKTAVIYHRLFHWLLTRLTGCIIAIFFALFVAAQPFEYMQVISTFIVFVLIISLQKNVNGFAGFFILGIVATFFFYTYKELLNFLLNSLPFIIVSAFSIKRFLDRKDKTQTI